MGYLGQAASFTGTQNNKRVSATATAGQVDFLPQGGYSIGAIDVYRNGVKLVGQKDFTALDGVTVTLTQGASENDSLEFVIFENFAVNEALFDTQDGDSSQFTTTVDGLNSEYMSDFVQNFEDNLKKKREKANEQ